MPNQTNVLLARQPIFDSNLNTVGYELLYRPIPTDEEGWQNHCGDLATNEVLVNAFDNIGIKNVTDNMPAYINFTQHWLHNPPPFNPEHVIIEVLEHILPTEENIKAISKLRDKGFTLALDDYLGDPAQDAFLPYIDIIKLDILAFKSMPKVKQTILDKGKDKYIWLAEKVETQEEYDLCVKAGCNFFQGFFFSKPINVYGEAMNSNKQTILELIIYLQNPDTTIEDLEVILSKDPSLSYRLLKLVNSAAFSRQYLVESLQQAIIIAGFDQIKAWVIMLSLGKMSDKPLELCKQSLQRAYFLQHLAQAFPETDKNTAFTAGLLSNLDAFFDSPLSKILDKVNLHNDINTALINKRGKLGFMYSTVLLMERGLWNKIRWDLWKKVGLSSIQVEWLYLESIKETDKLFKTTS